MNCLFFSVTILIFTTTTQGQKYTFTLDRLKLKMCIEEYLSKDSHLKIGRISKDLAELVAKRFHQKCYEKPKFDQAAHGMYYFIRDTRFALFENNEVPEQLRMSLRDALENCAERKNLPRFDHESRELAGFLDLILVDWPIPLNEMISSPDGRSTLRLYAYLAGLRLMSALRSFSMNFDIFHEELRRIWMNRAKQFFDGRGMEISYIRHRFTIDRDRMFSHITLEDIHTVDDIDSFESRRSVNFQRRNPALDLWNVNQVLNILKVGSFPSRISAAECYLETHMDQCYRIILLILELQMRGINTDEDDIYNGIIPSEALPFSIQKIVWNDGAYKKYMTAFHENFEMFPSEDFEGCFSSGISAAEESIMLLALSIVRRTASNILNTTATSITTVMVSSSTSFPGYKNESKKDGARIRDCEKYFYPDTMFETVFPQPDQVPGKRNENVNHYGYIIYKSDLRKIGELNESIFSKLLTSLSSFSLK